MPLRTQYDYHTIVLGAGASGLSSAKRLAKLGKSVLLIEQHLIGGNRTHHGSIPGKTFINIASAAHSLQTLPQRGLSYSLTNFSSHAVLKKVKETVSLKAEQEEVSTLNRLGIHFLRAKASFINPHTLSCMLPDGSVRNVTARFIIIATGSHSKKLDVEGIDSISYFTSDTIFNLTEIPTELTIIGTGQTAIELGQAFRRLGSKVTIIGRSSRILPKEEPLIGDLLQKQLENEGVSFLLEKEIDKVQQNAQNQVDIHFKDTTTLSTSLLLISIGRTLNTNHIGLQNADVYYNENGIKIDSYGRTTQKNIFAIGDVTGHGLYTHVGEFQARKVVKNIFFYPLRFSMGLKQPIPHVIFSDPEIASIGLLESDAVRQYGSHRIAIYEIPFSDLDRALTQDQTIGLIKIITKKWTGRILGATIVGRCAGELLTPLSIAINKKIPLYYFSRLMHSYPTYSQMFQMAADLYFSQTLIPFIKRPLKKHDLSA